MCSRQLLPDVVGQVRRRSARRSRGRGRAGAREIRSATSSERCRTSRQARCTGSSATAGRRRLPELTRPPCTPRTQIASTQARYRATISVLSAQCAGAPNGRHSGAHHISDREGPTSLVTELQLSNITVTFGGLTALDDVSLEVGRRQVHGVIGPNGAGKTTLFNVACGFVQPDSGRGRHAAGGASTGSDPRDLPGLGMARTLQGLGLFDRMTVLDNVMVGADHHARLGLPRLAARPPTRRARRAGPARSRHGVLDDLGVAAYADRYPPSLPYPIRKRVALARALVASPDLLLLDEPASGLSAAEMDELGDLVADAGRADVGAPRRAPHGPRDAGLHGDHRARLRPGDRPRHARPGARGPRRARGLPRRGRAADAHRSPACAPATARSRPSTTSPSPRPGRDHRRPRRQRRRQDHPAAHGLRPAPRALGHASTFAGDRPATGCRPRRCRGWAWPTSPRGAA